MAMFKEYRQNRQDRSNISVLKHIVGYYSVSFETHFNKDVKIANIVQLNGIGKCNKDKRVDLIP